ncbi:putative methyltransferase TARBP1 [Trachymyrmex septentrionalis]|uniref:Putative methyltransferase TARBP1 n=1 Tax=Trachymyrmex septentrionalis TaxID=34720 RepID=A0A195FXN9_9HYME|nr:putative methyltransferase TARBP1 [Trachymyrmex septentrionalis]
MDLHNRYLRFSTVNVSLLQTINKSISIHHLIQSYNYEMTKEELDVDKLEFCRLLLCYEYQSVFRNIEKCDKKHKKHLTPVNAKEPVNFPSVKMIFPPNCSRNISQISLLCDIINLQMILYYNIGSIKEYLQNFLYSNDMYIATNNSRIMYMKILEHLLEFLRLYQLHSIDKDSKALESFGHIYLEIIKSWLKFKEDCEWRQFALMFPKLVEIFTPSCIVFPLWNHFLYEINDLKESLIGLSIMADICFTSSNSMNYIQCDIYCNNTFWLLILKGLRSPLQQYRKQALYVMKKAIGSTSTNVILNFESQLNVTKAEITPFICSNSDSSLSIDDIKEKFFLLYEALEEKKEHLITPTLIHAAALIKINKEHRACNCFNIVWLQCILEKILLHENNHIAKWGVSYVCKLDKTMFDDQFLELFIHVLNNNFLYECQSDEKCPGIVKELSQFLEYAEKSDLLNRFVKKISCVAWGPVAIFYIVHVLRTISHHGSQHSDWQTTELNAIKFLVETNLSMHSRILRTASQTELLRAIPNYVRKINNLPLLANVLATFPSGESLTRGTVPWNVITTWLEKVLAREDVITFIKETCAKYLNQDASPEINPRTFAIMIYLLYDANLIFLCQTCPDIEALNNWLYTLNGINARPYADVILSMNVVEFISYLLYLSPMGSHNNMMDFISLHIRITFNFLIKNMRKMSTELSYENYTRYTAIVSSHIINAPFFMSKKDVNIYAEKLQNESINLIHDLQNLNIQYLYGLHTLYLSQNILTLPLTKTFYIKRLLNTRMNIHNDINEEKILKGKMASEYDLLLLKLLHQYLINSPVPSWIPITTILSNLLQFLEVGSPENVSEIAKILIIINDSKIINDTSDKETLEYIINLSFTYIINSKRNNIFWTAIENLMEVIINNNFLFLLNAIQFTKRYVVKLLNEGENTPRFKRILLSKMKNLDIHNLMKLENVLGNCFLHGSVHRRDKKIENYAHLFIEKQLDKYYSKHIFTLDHNNDAAIRAEAVILLHRIISNPECNCAASFGQSVLNELIKNKTKRYFKDSPLHKLKHRIMQILLILEPVLSKEFVPLLQEQLCDFIFSESNQSSVKIMQEWLLIRIFTKNIHLHDKLWSLFAKFILTQLYELMKANYGDNNISEYRGIYQAAVIGLQQESLTKNSSRIQDDFYFSNFHPFNDYCLQTIYYQLPRLTTVSCDEWISPNVFKDLMFMENDCHPLQLCNTDSFLTKSTPSVYLTKSFAGDTHGDSLENNVEIYMEGLNDIQKKIDPSKSIGLCGDIFEVINEFMFLQDTQLQEGLIVVASFVDRPPNLGGIARTCEIFGVKALVVANADCVKDKEFQYLSVSADKWLNILQVKPYELQKFLLDRKNTGWSLIGVEQTVNSTNLMTTTFEKSTILVLGNEKDGIPANFIPLFDKCVEIPQVGVTRSLNVHVTAAICIWQYANQHILK